jgi:hypothetical protein
VVIIDAGHFAVFQNKAGVGARNPAVQTLHAQIQVDQGTLATATPGIGASAGRAAGVF